MGVLTGTGGSYLIPSEVLVPVNKRIRERSIFSELAWRVPMTALSISIPHVDLSVTGVVGKSPLLGGLSLGWVADNVQLPQSEPKFGSCVLKAKNLTAAIYVSNQLVADGGEPLAEYLSHVISDAVAFGTDYSGFNGIGGAQPVGLINAPATYRVSRQQPNRVMQLDLANMVSRLIPACFPEAIWACTPTALVDIANMSTYMANRNSDLNAGSALCGTLFGRPLYVTECLPTLGTAGDVMLFDPSLVVRGDHSLTIEHSDQVRFLNNQTVFRVIWRGDIQPLASGTATLADGVTVAGTSVILE
jgi:HK97 family phage major capsid protein